MQTVKQSPEKEVNNTSQADASGRTSKPTNQLNSNSQKITSTEYKKKNQNCD